MNRRPTDEEVALLFHHIGKGVWQLQYVEDHLTTLLAITIDIKEPGTKTEEEIKEIVSKHKKGTLGALLKKGRDAGVLPFQLEANLTRFVDERNWLIHHSIDSHGKRLYSEAGRAETFERLARFIADAKAMQREISDEITRFSVGQGLDVEAAEADARAEVARLKHDA
jgi:hypothetical protein